MFAIRQTAVCAALGALCAVTALAQDANRDVAITTTDANVIVQKLSKRTGEFKEEFDKAVEHSLMKDSKLEGRAKHRADDLHDAAKKLEDVYHDKRDKNSPAVREQVDKTLAAAADVNHIMQDNRFTDRLQRDWELLRSDLNALAGLYDLSPM